MLKRKILSIWMGLCYTSLAILLAACDEACCCASPEGTGTLFLFPKLVVANNTSCSSPFFQITSKQFVTGSDGSCDSRGQFWYAEVKIGGSKLKSDGTLDCMWEKTYTINGDENHKFTIEQVNGLFAIKLTKVPINNGDIAADITIREPRQTSSCSVCSIIDANGNITGSKPFANTYSTKVGIPLPVNNLQLEVFCADSSLPEMVCCE